MPTMRGNDQCTNASPITPRCVCTTPYLASAAMNRRSHWMASVMPTPMACPLIAPITGLRTSHGGKRNPAALNVDVSTLPNVSPPRARSAPEQNAGGVPVRTTARMSSSSSQRRNASSSSGPMPAPNALRTSGRLSVTVATCSRTSKSSVSYSGDLGHASSLGTS